MSGDPVEAAAARRGEMVQSQLRARGIRDERVLGVMASLPREDFVPEGERSAAYSDNALPIEAGQTISQPYMVARMTELLAVRPGDRVLEIGTGSGYQAAVLASLGARVVTYERQPTLAAGARQRLERAGFADQVEVRVGDGSLGDADRAPWDAIIVTAGAPAIPLELRNQLAEGGRLVIPVGPRDRQILMLVERQGDDWSDRADGPCVFVPLIGAGGFPG